MKKYLCLAYYEPQRYEALSKDEREAIGAQCARYDQSLRDSGRMMMVASLAEPPQAKCLRPSGGRTLVTTGPYAETREVIGAFFIVEAESLDEAGRIASLHPAANIGEAAGWGIEVRPIEYFDMPAPGR